MKSSALMPNVPLIRRLPVSRQILGLAAWLAVSFVAGGIAAVASVNATGFYEHLVKPEWAPPAWVFGPVWGVLYLLMGVAAWLVWKAGGFERSGGALPMFVVQLGVNVLWTWLFFAWHLGAWSFAGVVLLWGFSLATLLLFWRVRPLAGMLMAPCLACVTFATVLCHEIWTMNPGDLG